MLVLEVKTRDDTFDERSPLHSILWTFGKILDTRDGRIFLFVFRDLVHRRLELLLLSCEMVDRSFLRQLGSLFLCRGRVGETVPLTSDLVQFPFMSVDNTNSVVTGYGDQLKIAEAANAKANEIAFSGAEDLEGLHFSGGIALGDGTVKYLDRVPIATSVHTGNAAVSVTSGHSFTYEASNLAANRTYRASVWTNSSNGRIYYMIDGGPGDFTSAVPTVSVDGWYRVDLEIPAQPNEFSLEVGVKSVGGEVYFDDFRFQPTQAVMTCYVYPPSDIIYSSPSQHTFVYHLDNQNLYTKYEYDQRGRVIKVYRESLHYGVKLMSESKQNFRRPMTE